MNGSLFIPLAFGLAASLATLFGGFLALRLASRITLIAAFTAGIVLGVSFFDLIPEALGLGADLYDARAIIGCTAVGFGGYMVLDRVLGAKGGYEGAWRAHLAPASLTLHSLLDGMGIGLAFQISPQIGWVIALAVLTHDIADGVNTVSLSMMTARRTTAVRWLIVNGCAPLIGVCLGLLVQIPSAVFAPLLGAFAGVFLYIGACELVPRSHLRDPRLRTTVASLAGMLLMLAVTTWAK